MIVMMEALEIPITILAVVGVLAVLLIGLLEVQVVGLVTMDMVVLLFCYIQRFW